MLGKMIVATGATAIGMSLTLVAAEAQVSDGVDATVGGTARPQEASTAYLLLFSMLYSHGHYDSAVDVALLANDTCNNGTRVQSNSEF